MSTNSLSVALASVSTSTNNRDELAQTLSSASSADDFNVIFGSATSPVSTMCNRAMFFATCLRVASAKSSPQTLQFHTKHITSLLPFIKSEIDALLLFSVILKRATGKIQLLSPTALTSALNEIADVIEQQRNDERAAVNEMNAAFEALQMLTASPHFSDAFVKRGLAVVVCRQLRADRGHRLLSGLACAHAASSTSLEVCKSFELGCVSIIAEVLRENVLAAAASEEEGGGGGGGRDCAGSSTAATAALHCLGLIQNLLREISINKAFWKNQQNIEALVTAAVAGTDEVRGTALSLLVANASTLDSEKTRKTGAKSQIKKSFSRLMTAAVSSCALQESTLSQNDQ